LFVAEKPENLASLSPSMPSSIVQSEQTPRHRNTNCQPFVVIDEHVPQKETRSTTFSSNLIGERVVLDEKAQELPITTNDTRHGTISDIYKGIEKVFEINKK
jgi:hypothetical protein